MSRRKDLAVPLLGGSDAPSPSCLSVLQMQCATVAGMLMVTAAALLFGVVAAFVKATALPTLMMLQARSMLEWALGVAVAMLYACNQRREDADELTPLPQAEASLILQRSASGRLVAPRTAAKVPESRSQTSSLAGLLDGLRRECGGDRSIPLLSYESGKCEAEHPRRCSSPTNAVK